MRCATCAGEASPGKLLCEQCRGYAQELEDIRLKLPARLALVLALVLLPGCASVSQAERAKLASDIIKAAPAACLIYQAGTVKTPEADVMCKAIQHPTCGEP